jgi:hypothetical protein
MSKVCTSAHVRFLILTPKTRHGLRRPLKTTNTPCPDTLLHVILDGHHPRPPPVLHGEGQPPPHATPITEQLQVVATAAAMLIFRQSIEIWPSSVERAEHGPACKRGVDHD